jgi:hypothetical protein
MGLVDTEGIDAIVAAEDAAIIAAGQNGLSRMVSDGTITAPAGTPLADLIEVLNGDQDYRGVGEPDR